MNILSVTFILFGTIVFITSFKGDKNVFSPARFWIILWSLVIGITQLKWSNLQNDWSNLTWVILISSLLSFLLAVYTTNVVLNRYTINTPNVISEINTKKNEEFLGKVIFVLILLYFLAYVIEYISIGFLPMFTENPSKSRLEFDIFGVHLIVNSILTIIILLAEYFIFFKPKKIKKMLFIALIITLLASYLFLMNRLYFLLFMFSYLLISNYGDNKVTLGKVSLYTLIFLSVFLIVGNIRLVQYAENFIYVVSEMKIPRQYAFIAGPYMYISMNLENLNVGLENLSGFSWGTHTFDFLLALIRGQDYLNFSHIANSKFQASDPFTTFPFMWYYYRDFGYLGVIIFPFVLGAITSYYYWRTRIAPSLANIAIYCILLNGLLLSFFTNMFTRLNFMFNLFLLIFVFLFFNKNHNITDKTKLKIDYITKYPASVK